MAQTLVEVGNYVPVDFPPPSPTSSTSSLTSLHTCSQPDKALSPELFSPTPTSQNKWPSPPPLPQRSPRIRRRHNLHNYASLASTNRSQEKRNSVGAPPLDYLTSESQNNSRTHTHTHREKVLTWVSCLHRSQSHIHSRISCQLLVKSTVICCFIAATAAYNQHFLIHVL